VSGSFVAVVAVSLIFYIAGFYVLPGDPPDPRHVPVVVLVAGLVVGSGRVLRRWLGRTRGTT
jgi:hypothetical protein